MLQKEVKKLTFEALLLGVTGPASGTIADGSVLLGPAESVGAARVFNETRVSAHLFDARPVCGTVRVHLAERLRGGSCEKVATRK